MKTHHNFSLDLDVALELEKIEKKSDLMNMLLRKHFGLNKK